MRAELELTERIEKYLNGEMNSSDKMVFEKEMDASSKLKEEVALQEQLMKGMQRVILKENAKIAYRKYRIGNNFLRWGLSGLGVILIAGAVYIGSETQNPISEKATAPISKNEIDVEEGNQVQENISASEETYSITANSVAAVKTPSIAFYSTTATTATLTTVADLYKQFEKPFQIFNIKAGKDTILKCAEGTTIKIDANSFVWGKAENKTDGIVQVRVREYYKNSDILLSNLSTTTAKEILETGGMLYVDASYKGEDCKIKTGKTIELGFPYKEKKKDMQLFEGKRDSAERMMWTLNKSSEQMKIIPGRGYTENNFLWSYGDTLNSNETIVPEIKPLFPGGNKEMQKYVSENTIYPYSVREKKVQGTVYVLFKVDEFGIVNNVRVMRGIDPMLDKVAYNLVRNMPKMEPAKHLGKPVSMQYQLPVKFSLKGDYTEEMIMKSKAIEKELKNIKVAYTNEDVAKADSTYKKQYETEFANSIVAGSASINAINSYLFSTSQLGWINCDRFINDSRGKINFTINYNAAESMDVKLIFHSVKSILAGYRMQGNKYSFNNVPVGEKVTIVAFKYDRGTPTMAIKESVISNKEESLVFELVTMEKLKAEMEKLNKLN